MKTQREPRPHLRLIGDVHGNLRAYEQAARHANYSFQVGDMALDYSKLNELNLDPQRHVFIGGNHDNYKMAPRPDMALEEVDFSRPFTILGPGEDNFAEPHVGYLDEVLDTPTVYEFCKFPPNMLGSFGIWTVPETENRIFYVRGAWSIDGVWRRRQATWERIHLGKTGENWWWPREQLSTAECKKALALYEQEKPDYVITHACPSSLLRYLRLAFSGGKAIPTQMGWLFQLMLDAHRPKLWVFGHYHQFWLEELDGTKFICLNHYDDGDGWTADFDKNMQMLGVDEHEHDLFDLDS